MDPGKRNAILKSAIAQVSEALSEAHAAAEGARILNASPSRQVLYSDRVTKLAKIKAGLYDLQVELARPPAPPVEYGSPILPPLKFVEAEVWNELEGLASDAVYCARVLSRTQHGDRLVSTFEMAAELVDQLRMKDDGEVAEDIERDAENRQADHDDAANDAEKLERDQ